MADSKVPVIRPASAAAAHYIANAGKSAAKAAPALPIETAVTGGALYGRSADAPKPTLGQLDQARQAMAAPVGAPGAPAPSTGRHFSPGTVEGLEAMAKHANAERAKNAPLPLVGGAAEPDKAPEAAPEKPKTPLSPYEAEREALEKRLPPIDLLSGLSTNNFKQHVPINPGKLEVTFQTLPPDHAHSLWLLLYKWIDKDKNLLEIGQEVISLMQLTCMLVSINGEPLPPYCEKQAGWEVFSEAAFLTKYRIVGGYPQQLVQVLGRHAEWFSARVSASFNVEAVKKS